ncbi:MAG: carbon monoxide dehydrogenase subunit G [Alphaproteobacteria bacterium]|nr:carbon monoxide dehydrogenase subunit G [Alphaproteobacteria bacterium]
MEMTGEQRLPAPREVVWAALNDPEILKQSIPGCEEIEKVSDTEMTAKVGAKVGPVSAKFTGQVTLSDLDPPNGYTISGEGKGGVAGFAKGGAKVRLEADGEGTLMRYEVTASVGGKLAQIGARLIDATAKKMADEFFNRFSALVAAKVGGAPAAESGDAEPAAVVPAIAPAAPAMPAPALGSMLGDAGAPRSGLSPMTWISLIVVIVLIILIFATR